MEQIQNCLLVIAKLSGLFVVPSNSGTRRSTFPNLGISLCRSKDTYMLLNYIHKANVKKKKKGAIEKHEYNTIGSVLIS